MSSCHRVNTALGMEEYKLEIDKTKAGNWHSTFVGVGLKAGLDLKLPKVLSNAFPMKYFISPLCRGIYALGCIIILGLIGTIFHALAICFYRKNEDRYAQHKAALIIDSMNFASLAFGVGEAAAFLYAINAKTGLGLALYVPSRVAYPKVESKIDESKVEDL